MADSYEIVHLAPASPEIYEQLGSKPKFWYRDSQDSQPWLFKFAREGTGEEWSEKIGAEVAEILGMPHARVELAVFLDKKGCVSRSFAEREKGFELIHGSEVLAGWASGYDKKKIRHQSAHCLSNILGAVQATVDPAVKEEQMKVLAGYLVLDAIIVNVDRHHDNWGLLREGKQGDGWTHVLAPTFDHASSLGRELLDDRREMYMKEKRVSEYVLRGSGAIYLSEKSTKGENPLVLVENAFKQHEDWFKPWIERIKALEIGQFQRIISLVPDDWMSERAKSFALEMMQFTLSRLRRLVP